MVYHSQPATTPPALVPAMLERRRGAISTRGAVRGDDCSVVDAGVDHSMVRAAPKRGARCGSRPLQVDRRRKPRRRRVDHRMIDSGIDHRTVVAAHGGGRGAAAKLAVESPLSMASVAVVVFIASAAPRWSSLQKKWRRDEGRRSSPAGRDD